MSTFSNKIHKKNIGLKWSETPLMVMWMATLRCQLSCSHCITSSSLKGMADMAKADVFKLIDEINDAGVSEFLITGGEPMIREDLAEIIEYLGTKDQCWSMNTAIFPSSDLQKAIEKSPPAFVAVSIDGPQHIHDKFRGRQDLYSEAMESIRFFSSLKNCNVAAGTTLTTFNYPYLEETFTHIVESKANEWGLHLLIPEGKAHGSDLFLNRKQLKRLLSFVAEKRKYFPVNMADEFGYCGEWEPFVRDLPLSCGAGRTHCVVLPDGEIVPCTTLDRSVSGGNILERPIMEIWKDSFGDIRDWKAKEKCRACDYTSACEGGCWLQRKNGTECFKDVWKMPQTYKTAAGIALCIGLLNSCASQENAVSENNTNNNNTVETIDLKKDHHGYEIDLLITKWFVKNMSENPYSVNVNNTKTTSFEISDSLMTDPLGKYLDKLFNGKINGNIKEVCDEINDCMDTKYSSLAVSALLWKNISEKCIINNPAVKRDKKESETIKECLKKLEINSQKWMRYVYLKKTAQYLKNSSDFYQGHRRMLSKAMPKPKEKHIELIEKERSRWLDLKYNEDMDIKKYLNTKPFTADYRVKIETKSETAYIIEGNKKRKIINDPIDIFDVIYLLKGTDLKLHWGNDESTVFMVKSLENTELTYIDLLFMAYEQMDQKQLSDIMKDYGNYWNGNPFYIPVYLNEVKKKTAEESQLYRMHQFINDFWMF